MILTIRTFQPYAFLQYTTHIIIISLYYAVGPRDLKSQNAESTFSLLSGPIQLFENCLVTFGILKLNYVTGFRQYFRLPLNPRTKNHRVHPVRARLQTPQ